ncbi:hypothetical protein, partial [Ilumatobacter sp.]|uniref:hypothetical protein n=1 Tax=Ilumatobacter sp. TaxID=1967498 RepID=UPI00375039E3
NSPLVPRSQPHFTAPLGPTFVGHGFTHPGAGSSLTNSPLVPRSQPHFTAPLGPTFVGHGFTHSGAGSFRMG